MDSLVLYEQTLMLTDSFPKLTRPRKWRSWKESHLWDRRILCFVLSREEKQLYYNVVLTTSQISLCFFNPSVILEAFF